MDNELFTKIDEVNPKFNPRLAKGVVVDFMKNTEEHISRIFQASEADYPDDLKFIRIERVDPYTDYLNRVYDKSFNIAKSDTYMVRVLFEFKGRPLKPFHMSLPYIREAGLITINGSTFLISPVLIDEGLSVGTDSIFIHVNKDKIRFMRVHYAMLVNGVRENGYVIYSDVYKGKPPKTIAKKYLRRTEKMKPVVALYLFAKKGVVGAFKDYLGVDIELGKDEINESNYPSDEWTILSSVSMKPVTLKGPNYIPPKWRIAVRNSSYNLEVMSLALSFFYCVDHFYEETSDENLNEISIWKLVLGMVLRPEEPSPLAALNSAERNLISLDTHLDVQVCASLASIGVHVHNIYELFLVIIRTYTTRIVRTTHDLATMYGKRLTVQRYILSTITDKIFSMGFKLQARKHDKNLKEKDVVDIIKTYIGINDISRINHKHAEVESASNSTDNIIPRLTSRLVLQKDLTRDSKSSSFTSDMVLDVSIAEVGNLTSMTGDATGRSRLNMFAVVDEDGTILRNDALRYITEPTQSQIQR